MSAGVLIETLQLMHLIFVNRIIVLHYEWKVEEAVFTFWRCYRRLIRISSLLKSNLKDDLIYLSSVKCNLLHVIAFLILYKDDGDFFMTMVSIR